MLVRYFAAAAASAGTEQEEVVAHATMTRSELQQVLTTLHPVAPPGEKTLAQVLPQCSWLVNGVRHQDPESTIAPASTVDVLPPFAGG
ncbi:MoaD/ThiS family protein [Kocuria sp. cx-455]|uniref:MoaD/ThiS family protein n=1 Tax=Kocuria sp. cx-455 TaxID=2771377 RepID=UPI001686F66B|nr:MoaD/ThiS family protein [Kocuria sp. cx-455]MBD2764296.1 MoaD/ThiS family protein [Kocuria sp. cx-455]